MTGTGRDQVGAGLERDWSNAPGTGRFWRDTTRSWRAHRLIRATIPSVPFLFASYLRVYEPLAAFDRERQRYWQRYVREGRVVAPLEGAVRQRTAVLEALGAGWTRLPDLPDDAYALESDDTLLICPWNLRVRVAEAALTVRDGVPTVLADAFVPPLFAGLARTVVDDWRSGSRVLEHGLPRLHEQIATWTVPLRWFGFFEGSERSLSLRRGGRFVRYRTEVSKALRRASHARAVLRRGIADAPALAAIEENVAWLEEFHPYSVLELDYGGLVELMSDEALREDDSPELVAVGLSAISRGERDAALAAYDRLAERWRAVQLLERCN